MAKMNFNVKKTIARINDPKNGPEFKDVTLASISLDSGEINFSITGATK